MCSKGHIAYLVEKECTAVRLFELTGAVFNRPRKRAFGMPKEFTLDQFARDSGTVDLYHRLVCTGTTLVEQVRNDLFTCTVGAGDKHTRLGGGNFLYYLTHMRNGTTLPYHTAALLRHFLAERTDLLPPTPHFGTQVLVFEGVLGRHKQTIEVEGLLDKVVRTFFKRIDGSLYRAMPRNHHHGTVHHLLGSDRVLKRTKHLHTVHLGHFDIGIDKVVGLLACHFDTFQPVLRCLYLIAFELQNLFERITNGTLVINHQYFCHYLCVFKCVAKVHFFLDVHKGLAPKEGGAVVECMVENSIEPLIGAFAFQSAESLNVWAYLDKIESTNVPPVGQQTQPRVPRHP